MLRRQIYAFLGVYGLLLQLMVAGLHVPPTLALAGLMSQPKTLLDSFSRSVIICTSSGLQTISLDKNGEPVSRDGQPVPSSNKSCPICQSLSSKSLAFAGQIIPLERPVLTSSTPSATVFHLDEFHPLSSLARAPPVV